MKGTRSEKKEEDNSNLSARSENEINFLEKKGLLDWDSDLSDFSEGERIKKNRENFLEDLNKNMFSKENTKKNELKIKEKNEEIPKEKNEEIPKKTHEKFEKNAEKFEKNQEKKPEKNQEKNQEKKPEKNQEKKPEKNQEKKPEKNPEKLEKNQEKPDKNQEKKPLEVYKSEEKLEKPHKEEISKLKEEKLQKTAELQELNKKEKTLEKKLEDLNKAVSAKAQEIKSLESEENRKNKLLYDQDKEILKKVQELQELEVRQKALKLKFNENTDKSLLLKEISKENENYSENEIKKIVKIQQIMKKMMSFFYVERQKTNKILMKAKGVFFPILERNRYTKNLLKSQKKCDLLVFFKKPERILSYKVIIMKPFINVFEHCFEMKLVFKEKRINNEEIIKLFKGLVNEILGNLILLENKRLCLEEFIVNGQEERSVALGDKYELFYLGPINSKIAMKEGNFRGFFMFFGFFFKKRKILFLKKSMFFLKKFFFF